MKLIAAVFCLSLALFQFPATAGETANQLTESEKADGWKLLFDGKTTGGWHPFKKQSSPGTGWSVAGDWLHCSGKAGGDIVSDRLFDEFELTWEWKIGTGGNSGLKYFVTPDRPSPLGHEYQMFDNPRMREPEAQATKNDTASFYDVLEPTTRPPVKPIGEVNTSRVLVKGNHIEHWLNGVKVLEYEAGSNQVRAAVANSKFKNTPGFGSRLKGHILLQDHGSEVWFRNIKVRNLAATP